MSYLDLSQLKLKGEYFAVYDNVLPQQLLAKLALICKNSAFEQVNRSGSEKDYSMLVFNDLNKIRKAKDINNFFNSLLSENFLDFIKDNFAVKLSGQTEVNFWKYARGHFLDRHLDKEYKKITFLFYLTENWQESNGGELVVECQNSGKNHKIFPHYNRLVILKRTNASWHEVKKVTGDQPRNCLQIIYK